MTLDEFWVFTVKENVFPTTPSRRGFPKTPRSPPSSRAHIQVSKSLAPNLVNKPTSIPVPNTRSRVRSVGMVPEKNSCAVPNDNAGKRRHITYLPPSSELAYKERRRGLYMGMRSLEKGRDKERWNTTRRLRGRWMREVMVGMISVVWREREEDPS